MANALWGQKGFPWRLNFLDRQSRRFGAGFNEADFRANPEAERLRINQWVEGQTRDRIKELLAKGTLDTLTRMVLANAIYFKGEWAELFEKRQTRNAPFILADGSTKPVSMMARSRGPARVRFGDDVSVAELSNKGGEVSMVVVLPTKPDGLPAVEEVVNATQVATWLGQAREATETPILLPKFRVENDSRLNNPLKALGMVTVFDPGKADLSGLHQGSARLHVSLVVHKVFGDVCEEGTEAAAATAVVVKGDSGVRAFHADHPFLFLIRDVKRGTILFMGRYETP